MNELGLSNYLNTSSCSSLVISCASPQMPKSLPKTLSCEKSFRTMNLANPDWNNRITEVVLYMKSRQITV